MFEFGRVASLTCSRAGFAYRETFERFLDRFKLICDKTWPRWKGSPKEGVEVQILFIEF